MEERRLPGWTGTQGHWQVKLWLLVVQLFSLLNQINYYSPGFDCINFKLASTLAGGMSLVGCFCSNVDNGTSIPTGGTLGESSDAYDELSSFSWKSSRVRDFKVESGGKSWCL